ncbi:hypothetical protein EVAR_11034_1 [Eumeta japonica]|uniref:Uncharacterized protein n=1 Tax=Eumeta variegata TaxID=151549 RepID=A0A4C1U3P0_EUMVA|nr:hypothetical protein EVAR_11034_1 [Eumeta japonica]
MTPPEKAPPTNPDGRDFGGRYRVGKDEGRSVHRLPHNKSAKVVGGGGADGQNCGAGQRDRRGVLQRYRPSGFCQAGEPEGGDWPPVAVRVGTEAEDLSGNSAGESRESTPRVSTDTPGGIRDRHPAMGAKSA